MLISLESLACMKTRIRWRYLDSYQNTNIIIISLISY
jgi:hypothetical protein